MKKVTRSTKKNIAYAIILIGCLFLQLSYAQTTPNRLAQLIQDKKATESFKSVSPFNISVNESIYDKVSKGSVFTVSESDLRQIIKENSKTIKLFIPVNNTPGFELELSKTYIGGDYINVTLKGNHELVKKKIKSGLHYRGIIKGNETSYASISIHENNISGIISNGNGNYVLGKLKNEKNQYVFYNERDLISPPTFQCATSDKLSSIIDNNLKNGNNSTMATNSDCKVVKCFYECDYQMYLDLGGGLDPEPVVDFIVDAFGQVSTLYYNEGVICEISEIVVWDNDDFILDKYPLNSFTADIFPVLSTIIAEEGSSFNGDIAQFITSRTDIHPAGSGGVAATINSLCNKYFSHAVVNIKPSSIYGFPDYLSFTAAILAHEMGHLLGSPHTHACFWNGDDTALDDCPGNVDPPSGCLVSSTAPSLNTTMSYCFPHEFSEGFGPQPGTLIYDNVSNAECLNGSSEFIPTGLTINGDEISWDAVSGAAEYTLQYKLLLDDGCGFENNWNTISAIYTTYTALSDLTHPGVAYLYRIASDCSPFSESQFSTEDNSECTDPSAKLSEDVTTHTVILSWEKCDGFSTYDLRIRETGTSTWTNYNSIAGNFKRVFNLDDDTEYEWQAKVNSSSNWSYSTYFTTLEDIEPENFYHCDNGNNNADFYIDEVNLFDFNNISGADIGGLGDFRASSSIYKVWHPNEVFDISTIKNSLSDDVFITIFIDWNRDGDYFDEGEDVIRIFDEFDDLTYFSGNCIFPVNSFSPGWTNLRISYMYTINGEVAPYQCNDFTDGEAEDYSLFLDPEAMMCIPLRKSFFFPSAFDIFPNPAGEIINLSIKNKNLEEQTFCNIYDISGHLLKKIEIKGKTSIININDLAKGFYQLSIYNRENFQKNVKFIKL